MSALFYVNQISVFYIAATIFPAAAQAAAVPAGLRLGLRGSGNAAAQLWSESPVGQGARGGEMRDPMTDPPAERR